jgi:hypothetical protein
MPGIWALYNIPFGHNEIPFSHHHRHLTSCCVHSTCWTSHRLSVYSFIISMSDNVRVRDSSWSFTPLSPLCYGRHHFCAAWSTATSPKFMPCCTVTSSSFLSICLSMAQSCKLFKECSEWAMNGHLGSNLP